MWALRDQGWHLKVLVLEEWWLLPVTGNSPDKHWQRSYQMYSWSMCQSLNGLEFLSATCCPEYHWIAFLWQFKHRCLKFCSMCTQWSFIPHFQGTFKFYCITVLTTGLIEQEQFQFFFKWKGLYKKTTTEDKRTAIKIFHNPTTSTLFIKIGIFKWVSLF